MVTNLFENKLIYILHHQLYFGQSLPTFKSMDVDLLISKFELLGANVSLLSYEELPEHEVDVEAIYLTGSHQNPVVKSYVEDVLDLKFSGKDNLYPNIQLVKAHENKGYQGMLAKNMGLDYIKQDYFVENKDITETVVVKSIGGAGSAGVALASNTLSLRNFTGKLHKMVLPLPRYLYIIRAWFNKVFKRGAYSNEAWDYYRPRSRFVIQELIPNLSFDYKVLVFGKKVFVLKRGTKDGDFRASGSGLFSFITVENELLDFAYTQKNTIKAPYISMDVVPTNNGYKCIEYQCVHFGPYTQMKAPFYYVKTDDSWDKVSNNTVLEELIVESVVDMYISNRAC